MAFENLIIRKTRSIGGIAIDGVIEETTTRNMRVTNFPVENGNNIADHIIREPLTFTLRGVVTDNPLGFAALTGIADSISGIFGKSDSTGQTRSQQIYSSLVDLLEARDLIEVQSSLKVYTDLAFESITVTQDKDKARAIFFTATFKQVLLVKSASSEVDPNNIESPADKAGQGDALTKGSAITTETTAAQNSTIANSGAK